MAVGDREFGRLEEKVQNLDEDMREMGKSLLSIRNQIRIITLLMLLMFMDVATTNPLLASLARTLSLFP